MTDEEVEAVAAELAKAGGISWHARQERGPLKLVMDRYRDRAAWPLLPLSAFGQRGTTSRSDQAHKPTWSPPRAMLCLRGAWSCTALQGTTELIPAGLRRSLGAACISSRSSPPALAGWILKTFPLRPSSKVSQP